MFSQRTSSFLQSAFIGVYVMYEITFNTCMQAYLSYHRLLCLSKSIVTSGHTNRAVTSCYHSRRKHHCSKHNHYPIFRVHSLWIQSWLNLWWQQCLDSLLKLFWMSELHVFIFHRGKGYAWCRVAEKRVGLARTHPKVVSFGKHPLRAHNL